MPCSQLIPQSGPWIWLLGSEPVTADMDNWTVWMIKRNAKIRWQTFRYCSARAYDMSFTGSSIKGENGQVTRHTEGARFKVFKQFERKPVVRRAELWKGGSCSAPVPIQRRPSHCSAAFFFLYTIAWLTWERGWPGARIPRSCLSPSACSQSVDGFHILGIKHGA